MSPALPSTVSTGDCRTPSSRHITKEYDPQEPMSVTAALSDHPRHSHSPSASIRSAYTSVMRQATLTAKGANAGLPLDEQSPPDYEKAIKTVLGRVQYHDLPPEAHEVLMEAIEERDKLDTRFALELDDMKTMIDDMETQPPAQSTSVLTSFKWRFALGEVVARAGVEDPQESDLLRIVGRFRGERQTEERPFSEGVIGYETVPYGAPSDTPTRWYGQHHFQPHPA